MECYDFKSRHAVCHETYKDRLTCDTHGMPTVTVKIPAKHNITLLLKSLITKYLSVEQKSALLCAPW